MENNLELVLSSPCWLLFLGPIIGSFLGTIVCRLPAGKPILGSRSRCQMCGTSLGPLDLVPILSWLASRRCCRHCGGAVSFFYPLMELAALCVPLWVMTRFVGWPLLTTSALGWTLLVLAVIDWRHSILPDSLTLPLVPLGFLVAWMDDTKLLRDHFIGAVTGYLFFILISTVYRKLRGQEGLGLGDAKLLAAAGSWVSWVALADVVLIASCTALTLAIIQSRGALSATDQVPFGPHLCLGFWLVWVYGPLFSVPSFAALIY